MTLPREMLAAILAIRDVEPTIANGRNELAAMRAWENARRKAKLQK